MNRRRVNKIKSTNYLRVGLCLMAGILIHSSSYAQSLKSWQVWGFYIHNIETQGWTNLDKPDGSRMEIAPPPPHWETIKLRPFHKAVKHNRRFNFKHKMKWYLENDTIILKFKTQMQENGILKIVDREEKYVMNSEKDGLIAVNGSQGYGQERRSFFWREDCFLYRWWDRILY